MSALQAFVEVCHEQDEPSNIWMVEHHTDNMTPIAECFEKGDATKRIYPIEVKAISQEKVAISFSRPQTGKAYII